MFDIGTASDRANPMEDHGEQQGEKIVRPLGAAGLLQRQCPIIPGFV
jgi:hypothetical protein